MTGFTRLLVVALAVLPGAFALWRGRRLALLADDPALPERLLANRNGTSAVSAFCFVVLLTTAGNHLAWAIPLLIVTRMAAGYPLRRILYRETWSLAAYLSFFLRVAFAVFGFWILLVMTPSLVAMSESHEWMVAGVLAILLVAWSEAYGIVFRAVLRTRAVDDRVVVDRFARMLKSGGLPAVALEQVDLRGGVFANAVALPSTRRPAVMVSSTLIERLDHDEVAAILGHELAHIEHFNPRRLRHMSLVTYALVAAGALLSPIARLAAPQALTAMMYVWSIGLIAAMALRAQHRQKHETASDLRALALAGDSEALIRALTKLHAFARLPRRWDTEFERHATHPSLARRIQAIQAAAGTAPAALSEAATFAGADGSSSVTFDNERLLWNEGPSGSHALDYGHVTMLRLDVRRSGTPRLVAVDRAHRRWEIVLQSSDIARAQATLDIVDTRLAATAGPPVVSLAVSRVLAFLVVIAAVTTSQIPVMLLGWIAAVRPAPSVTAAAGAAAVGAAALIWREGHTWLKDTQPWMALVLMLCGLSLIAVSVANRREKTPALVSAMAGLLAICTAGACGAIAFAGFNAIDLHYAALEWPSAGVLALALAGACAFTRWPSLRYACAPLALAGLAVFALGSTSFLDRFGNDPFLRQGEPVTMTIVTANPRTEFSVPFDVTALRLSPAGQFVALDSETEDEQTTIHAGRAGGPLTDFAGDDAVFVDEGRLMTLERQRGASVLRVVDLGHADLDVWSIRVPLSGARLSFDAASSQWRLLGWNAGDIVSASGAIGDHDASEERWTTPVDDHDYLDALSISGHEILALETRWRARAFSGLSWQFADMLQPRRHRESRFWTMSRSASSAFMTSRLDLSCQSNAVADAAVTCAAFDGARTGFFAVGPTTRESTAPASVPGHFYLRTDAGRGWVLGWWDRRLVLLRAATREAISVVAADGTRATQLAIAGKTLGATSLNAHGSTVRLYAID